MVNQFSTRAARLLSGGKKKVFSTNAAVTTRYPHAKEWSWTLISIICNYCICKLTQNGSDLNGRSNIITLLEENVGLGSGKS